MAPPPRSRQLTRGEDSCATQATCRPWGFPRVALAAYVQLVITLVRLARVLLLLLLAFFAVSFVIGLGTPQTGAVERVVLLALIAGCVFLAAKVSTLATKAQTRLQRP